MVCIVDVRQPAGRSFGITGKVDVRQPAGRGFGITGKCMYNSRQVAAGYSKVYKAAGRSQLRDYRQSGCTTAGRSQFRDYRQSGCTTTGRSRLWNYRHDGCMIADKPGIGLTGIVVMRCQQPRLRYYREIVAARQPPSPDLKITGIVLIR